MTITDKQVEAACVAYVGGNDAFRSLLSSGCEGLLNDMRAALEAAEAARDATPVGFRVGRGGQWLFASTAYDASIVQNHREAGAQVELLYAAPSSAEQAGDGPDAPDGHDAEGFQGGCDRFGCAPGAPCRTAPGAPEADERSRFEAAMRDEPYANDLFASRTDGEYLYSKAELAWRAWQAARAQSSAAPVAVAEVCAIGLGDGVTAGSRMILRPLTDAVFPVGTKLYAAPVSARDGEAVAGARYFSFSGDAGFDIHKSRDEAEAHAQAALDDYRDEAMDDGWPEDVAQICWGVVLGGSQKSYGDPIPEDMLARYDASPGDRFVSYSLAAEATPPADARDGGNNHGLDTDTHVFFYEQDFYVLSNFSAFRVTFKGKTFDTSEAAYHYQRFPGPIDQFAIQHAESAHAAFRYAQQNKAYQRPDWDEVKFAVMRQILRAKVEQHEYVRRKLLATGDRILVENSWRDPVWGWGPNRDGQNMLGNIWMEIRAELRAAIDRAMGATPAGAEGGGV